MISTFIFSWKPNSLFSQLTTSSLAQNSNSATIPRSSHRTLTFKAKPLDEGNTLLWYCFTVKPLMSNRGLVGDIIAASNTRRTVVAINNLL